MSERLFLGEKNGCSSARGEVELLKRARLELALRSALGCLSPPSPGPVFWLSNPIKAPLDGKEPAAGGHACEEQGRANLLHHTLSPGYLQAAPAWLWITVTSDNSRKLGQPESSSS